MFVRVHVWARSEGVHLKTDTYLSRLPSTGQEFVECVVCTVQLLLECELRSSPIQPVSLKDTPDFFRIKCIKTGFLENDLTILNHFFRSFFIR